MIDQLSATNERQNDSCTVEIKQIESNGLSEKKNHDSKHAEDSSILKSKYEKNKNNDES